MKRSRLVRSITSSRPFLAITMGDPAGIGPEIIVKALATRAVWQVCRPVVIGSPMVFSQTMRDLKSQLKSILLDGEIPFDEQAPFSFGALPLVEAGSSPHRSIPMGKPSSLSGAASIECIKKAVALAQQHRVAGLVTAPINKKAIHLAGFKYPGHTEFLADLTHSQHVGMMLVGGPLKVLLATTHVALRDIPVSLSQHNIEKAIRLAHVAMRTYFRRRHPKIGVAALNPHAGEQGLFGDEERRLIAPSIRKARKAGIHATGPLPADTLFGIAAKGAYDVVVALYHDQGLIPLKLLAFGKCVNITVGLPILRTSVDHGTAYDIVRKNQADSGSLIEAITLAAQLASLKTSGRQTLINQGA